MLEPGVEEPEEEVDQEERPAARKLAEPRVVPDVEEPEDQCWLRCAGRTACVAEFQARRPACPNLDGTPKNELRAHASQKTTSTPTRSAQRARRLRDAVNDQPMRQPATEKVLAQRPNRLLGTSEEVPCGWTGASCVIRVPSAPWSPAKPRGLLEKRKEENIIQTTSTPKLYAPRARDSECGER